MNGSAKLLLDLALVLGVGTVTSLVFRWLRLPVVMGYILAGLLVGPHVPIPLLADESNIRTLSELGVTLLMFGLGMEFSLHRLFRAGPTALLMVSIQGGLAMALGFLVSFALGWGRMEAIFVGAALSISSTMVVTKVFEEWPVETPVREMVFSMLVMQDLMAILLLTALTPLARVGVMNPIELGRTLLWLGGFLVLVLVPGRMIVPRLMRWVADNTRSETLLITSAGLCFVMAEMAAKAGFSVALGAFLGGMLAAESGRVRAIERLVHPLRDVFTAIFFVSVGMLIQPRVVLEHSTAVIVLSLVVVIANTVSITAGGLLTGHPLKVSVKSGMALSQIGEFGYIILGIGVATASIRPDLYSVGVAVGVVTAFATPFLLRASHPFATAVENRLPRAFRASLGVYQAWAEGLRRKGIRHGEGVELRKPALLLLLDLLLLAALAIGNRLLMDKLSHWMEMHFQWGHVSIKVALSAAFGLIAALLVLEILRRSRFLARDLAVLAPLPGDSFMARKGRHLLAGGLRVALLLMVGLPMVAVLQPFAPGGPLLAVTAVVFAATAIVQVRRARRLNREVPGVVDWLLDSPRQERLAPESGTLRAVRLEAGHPSLGHPLSDFALDHVTVVALLRKDGTLARIHPNVHLEEGDTLGLAGPQAYLDTAEEQLRRSQ
jgi:CPA2 family monovalent cation:H+ antiporter-2